LLASELYTGHKTRNKHNMSSNSKPSPPTVLPRYADQDSESASLLPLSGVDVKSGPEGISGQCDAFAAPVPQRRCTRFGRCKRGSKEPECENRRCVRRRKITRFFLFLISAFFFFHLAKFAYTLYTLPNHIQCHDIIDSTTTIELPWHRRAFFHRSLSADTLSVIRDKDIAEGSFKVQVEFDSIEDANDSVLCHGTFKRALMFGAFTKEEGGSLPTIKQTTVILPASAPTPFIGFGLGGRKGKAHCAEKLIRMFLNFKKKGAEED